MSKRAQRLANQKLPQVSTAQAAPKEPRALCISNADGETQAQALARHVAGPIVSATRTIDSLHGGEVSGAQLDATELMHELERQVKAVNDGSLVRGEAMLVSQAHTLDAMFHALVLKAMTHRTLDPYETLLRLAFKAQSQCRTTIEALAEIKNPRSVAFVRQANIAQGHQQVNNHAGAGETESPQTKLLETTRNEWMDTRATRKTGGSDQALEAVGTVDGAAH